MKFHLPHLPKKYTLPILLLLATLSTLLLPSLQTPPTNSQPLSPPSRKQQIQQLIQQLHFCPPDVEPWICQSLRELTYIHFDYPKAKTPRQKQIVRKKWISWWQKAKHQSLHQWLLQAALNPHYPYRYHALHTLNSLPPPQQPSLHLPLLQLAQNPKTPKPLQKEATLLLGHWQVKSAIHFLQNALSQPHLAYAALISLRKLKAGFSHILPLLQHPQGRIRQQAAQALFEISPQRALPYLLPLLNDPEKIVRFFTLDALQKSLPPQTLKKHIHHYVPSQTRQKELLHYLQQ